MRKPFRSAKRRETPVPTTDLDPAPTTDFHDADAARRKRARLARERADDTAGRRATNAESDLAKTDRVVRGNAARRPEPRPLNAGPGEDFVVHFEQTKVTKGAVQFGEVDERGNLITDFKLAKIGSVYVRKDAMDGAEWTSLTLTVSGR